MHILKFGGTSVGSVDAIHLVTHAVKNAVARGKVCVVVSAFQGITDLLITTASLASSRDALYTNRFDEIQQRHLSAVDGLGLNQTDVLKDVEVRLQELRDVLHGVYLIKELTPRTLDLVMSFGELLSARIITEAFTAAGLRASFLDTRSLIKTDDQFGGARVDYQRTNPNVRNYFANHPELLHVATGFIGSTLEDVTTTLGRGGSDYTASIIGAALNVEEIEIWTDVNGVMTADPRKVDSAFSIPGMTYEEAMEMSHFGAKIIHPPTMQPALDQGIPIRIKNTFHPEFAGTVISASIHTTDFLIKGISSISNVSLLTIQGSGLIGIAGISHRLFGALARKKISVILITQASSEHSICIAVDPKNDEQAKRLIEEEFSLEIFARQVDPVILERDLSIMAVVGENMRHTPGISGRIFQALGNNGVNVVAVAQGSSELNVSVVINKNQEQLALNAVHQTFFFPGSRSKDIFIAGTGLIGSELIDQIDRTSASLKENHGINIQLVGLSNSRNMLFNDNGLNLEAWKSELKGSQKSATCFEKTVLARGSRRSIFVDCTASDAMAPLYIRFLESGIPVVTANKKALTGPISEFRKMQQAALRSGVPLYFETTVGAGLPIISTLRDLLLSGDEIVRIEAVLSGTLSFLFNSFSAETKFSDLLMRAKELGFTEPDPREDLNGMDVARKLLILSRVAGWSMELEDISIESLVPQNLSSVPAGEFLLRLHEADPFYENLRQKAAGQKKVLRYSAILENRKASVSLNAVDSSHPFYSLSGTDNMVSFVTKRYCDTPLVVRGPGAGPKVTAAGVFADVLKCI